MSAETAPPQDATETDLRAPLEAAPDLVEVRRNAGVLGAVGALAGAVAIAWYARAASSGAVLDWVMAGGVSLIAAFHLWALVDARTALLVADGQGVRLRRGRAWRGLPWSALEAVEVEPRRNPLRDGHLTVVPDAPDEVLADLGRSRLPSWVSGDPLSVPLGLATRVVGAPEGLPDALAGLAGSATDVVELVPDEDLADTAAAAAPAVPAESATAAPAASSYDQEPRFLRDPRPALAAGISALAARLPGLHPDSSGGAEREKTRQGADESVVVASAEPTPVRDPRAASRAEVESTLGATALKRDPAEDDDERRRELPEARELRRPGSVSLVEDTQVWGDRVSPIARPGDAVAPLVIGEADLEPASDPVIGPEIAAARTRLRLSVDELAERTRIRPHVIESIEVDDFTPCGGDFYARGHLRTLSRVLGIDVAPLLASYDERYAHAPISPRKVFEAELATGGGSLRATRGGLNWSLLVAVLMALVLAWSVARLVMDAPVELKQVPGLGAGSGGLRSGTSASGDQIPVLLHAASGGARVVVRNGDGQVVFTGDLSYGATRSLKVAPPVRIESSDGGVEVVVDGVEKGRLGDTGEPASGTFIAE